MAPVSQPYIVNVALDLIFGPIYYRLLVGHRPLDEGFARSLPDRVMAALTMAGDGR